VAAVVIVKENPPGRGGGGVFLHFGALRSRSSELFQVRCIQLFGIFGR